jgi:hypothetical protein
MVLTKRPQWHPLAWRRGAKRGTVTVVARMSTIFIFTSTAQPGYSPAIFGLIERQPGRPIYLIQNIANNLNAGGSARVPNLDIRLHHFDVRNQCREWNRRAATPPCARLLLEAARHKTIACPLSLRLTATYADAPTARNVFHYEPHQLGFAGFQVNPLEAL